jgi:hypothetical protein
MMVELEQNVAQNEFVEIEQQIHQLVEHRKVLKNDIEIIRGALKLVKKIFILLELKKRLTSQYSPMLKTS